MEPFSTEKTTANPRLLNSHLIYNTRWPALCLNLLRTVMPPAMALAWPGKEWRALNYSHEREEKG
jgi:hypothetical protein